MDADPKYVSINDQPLKGAMMLKHQDVINIIDRKFRFEYPAWSVMQSDSELADTDGTPRTSAGSKTRLSSAKLQRVSTNVNENTRPTPKKRRSKGEAMTPSITPKFAAKGGKFKKTPAKWTPLGTLRSNSPTDKSAKKHSMKSITPKITQSSLPIISARSRDQDIKKRSSRKLSRSGTESAQTSATPVPKPDEQLSKSTSKKKITPPASGSKPTSKIDKSSTPKLPRSNAKASPSSSVKKLLKFSPSPKVNISTRQTLRSDKKSPNTTSSSEGDVFFTPTSSSTKNSPKQMSSAKRQASASADSGSVKKSLRFSTSKVQETIAPQTPASSKSPKTPRESIKRSPKSATPYALVRRSGSGRKLKLSSTPRVAADVVSKSAKKSAKLSSTPAKRTVPGENYLNLNFYPMHICMCTFGTPTTGCPSRSYQAPLITEQ